MPTYFGLRPCVRAAALTLTLILSACGGGGGGGQPEARTSDKGDGSDVVTMSGTLSLVETAAVDSDTNDPNQADRRSNDDVPQALSTPVNLVGTVNEPGAGPDGPNKTAGDQVDIFEVDLQANQTIDLQFGADPGVNDLDLVVLDDRPKSVGISDGSGSSECMRISKTGRYYIAVYAHGGASIYNLRIGSPDSVSSCPNATSTEDAIVAGQVIAQPLDGNMVASTRTSGVAGGTTGAPKQAQGTKSMRAFHREAGLTQLDVPRGAPNLLTLPSTAQARLKGLSQLASYTSFKRASALAQQATRPARRHESLAQALDTISYAKALMATGQYKFVSLNHRVQLSQVAGDVGNFPPNDPIYPKQRWHYEQINLPAAMDRLVNLPTQPARRPLVAVIDSGIMADHPDLAPQIEGGRTFVSLNTRNDGQLDSANPDDLDVPTAAGDPHFHGTHVAGTIAARTFDGYRRKNGRAGTRNEIWVLCTVGCVANTARRIRRSDSTEVRYLAAAAAAASASVVTGSHPCG